ncbi:S-adenosyl-L-methionine-dependent methyltransferase [Thermothelomyces heterothallicus CBS 202.75]|uniref:S-adenosyl-L-methionine-dependent methyltransferase n=1 Tax=Thermothelomyces heterothallicus CBS 202.75 TaxID=1149848 RepID=UPI0037448914
MLPPALASLVDPFLFMGLALSFLPSTVLSALLARDFATLLSPSRLRSAWFGRFWAHVGPTVRQNAEKNVVPLLQGRVAGGAIVPGPPTTPAPSSDSDAAAGARPHPAVSGTVLEVGPGSGMWVSLYSPQNLPASTGGGGGDGGGIRKIYGVEPNPTVHSLLRRQVAAAGLDDGTYEIVPLGIEDLAASGRVPLGSVDCIVTVMCLCSIPDPRRNMAQLYRFLKPGGRWYVYEHVRCFHWQGWGMRLYQAFLGIFWPHLIGGCEMCRDTGKWLTEVAPWSQVDLCQLQDEPWYFTMPHVIGVLTK